MIPEAPLERTDVGLVPAGAGWFVLNARDARWIHREGRGDFLPFTGWTRAEADKYFPQVGVNLYVLNPGDPASMYHGEDSQEDFLVLKGECLLIIEGQERPLKQWDFAHCPPWAEHTIIGAGDGPCIVLGTGTRGGEGIRYPVDATAIKHGAGIEQETDTPAEAYSRFQKPEPTRYRDGWLPQLATRYRRSRP
jgi:uncharacterized cupin superfamily protein